MLFWDNYCLFFLFFARFLRLEKSAERFEIQIFYLFYLSVYTFESIETFIEFHDVGIVLVLLRNQVFSFIFRDKLKKSVQIKIQLKLWGIKFL